MKQDIYEVVVIGAGAAGLMASWQAGVKGKKTLLIEHTDKIGEKIRISGGGRCNFTNLHASPQNYLSNNKHFVKSALSSYTQHDFIKLIESHNIRYHEKTLGQLFCDNSAKQIIDMFVDLCAKANVAIKLNCSVKNITKNDNFILESDQGIIETKSLIIASGGLSIPKIGASNFGYELAKKFGLNIIPPKPALVPLVTDKNDKVFLENLRGISNYSIVSYDKINFEENILFTHKGLSGPAILQISSYLKNQKNDFITINLLPVIDLKQEFIKNKNSKQSLSNFLKQYLPNNFVDSCDFIQQHNYKLTDLKNQYLLDIADYLHKFTIHIIDTEGYNKAEVTVGGVNTDELSSKTMESKKIPNLYFIGEVVDVTGWLGGYNFQWAWSSGYAAGKSV